MHPETPEFNNDDAPPTEEVYMELRDLEATAAEASEKAVPDELSPALPEDYPAGVKARIARLRAVLSDRGAEPKD